MKSSETATSRILCVDDDSASLDIYGACLTDAGYQVYLAENAEDGYRLAFDKRPDIIISDVVMPGDSGLDFCKRVRETSALRTTIFILASAVKTDNEHMRQGVDAGADDYLFKPVQPFELLNKIKSFLRIKALQDKLVASNSKLNTALAELEGYKTKLEEKNQALSKEKEMLQNSLRQIQLMVADRERTNKQLEALNAAREDNFNGLISLLSGTIESKRQYHRGHSRKVAEISIFIADEVGLDPSEVRVIEIAALLHELGKLSIPDELAMKNPESYTQAERDFLSRHPVEGAALLETFPGLHAVATVIRHFHENVDGTGTPDGLKGEHIPIGSRIIAAANLYDNLVYRRKGGRIETALEIIEAHVGARLDARIVHYLHKYAAGHPVKASDKARAVKLVELEPGMTLAAGIFSTKGAKLLPINTVLTESAIRQIAQFHKQEPIEDIVFVKD